MCFVMYMYLRTKKEVPSTPEMNARKTPPNEAVPFKT